MATAEPHTLQCLEVWGGNQATENGVVMPGLDAWVYSRPFEGNASGGDLHFLSSCATGRIVRLLVADVSGHGESVAQVSSTLRSLMRRYVNFVDQARILGTLNREFGALADAGTFATAIVATYWTPTDQLTICNAGHPRPMRFRAAKRAWEFLESRGATNEDIANIPLGIADARYDQFELRLGRDDLLLFYTDSLPEARSPTGDLLGDDGLLRMVQGVDVSDPNAFVATVVARIAEYRGGKPPDDDLTALLLRPNAFKPRGSIWTGMKAGLGLARSLLPGSGRFPWPEMTAKNFLGAFVDRLNRE